MLASSEVLETFRNDGSIDKIKTLLRRKGPAFSAAHLNAGGMLALIGSARAGFKSVLVTEIDKDFKAAIHDLTGQASAGDTFRVKAEEQHSPAFISVTTECPNYSGGSPAVQKGLLHGVDGDSGWQFILSVQPVLKMKPLIIEYEMVHNVVNVHGGKELLFVVETICKNGYVMDVATVTMQQYGEVMNKERLMVVGNHVCLGEAAHAYSIPLGHFSDAVSYCARDIIDDVQIPSDKRVNNDKPVPSRTSMPGKLQMAARFAPGQGYSTNPHASYKLDGLTPAPTTHGTGRHQPEDWQQGDEVGTSYMFTVAEVARAQNVADDYVPYLTQFSTDPKFALRALAMGFGQRFALAMASSHIDTLVKAGVPYDILETMSIPPKDGKPSKVKHRFMDESTWMRWRKTGNTGRPTDDEFTPLDKKRRDSIKAAALHLDFLQPENYLAILSSAQKANAGGQHSLFAARTEILSAVNRISDRETKAPPGAVLQAVFDTGAQRIILLDEQVGTYVRSTGKEQKIVIVPAAKGSEFSPAKVGKLQMMMGDGKNKTVHKMPVITASQKQLSKPLMAYEPFYEKGMQLDIRTPAATKAGHGSSRMWLLQAPNKPEVSIPLHRDDEGSRWWINYTPQQMEDEYHTDLLHCVTEDIDTLIADNHEAKLEYEPMLQFDAALVTVAVAVEAFVKEVITRRDVNEAKTSTAVLPEGKRLDIIFARHEDDHATRGIKCHMPKSKFKKMSQAVFARHLNHTGCGPHCPICLMASGAMRTIFKIVDKYLETRSGYMISMDMQVLSHRSRQGMKYYVTVRCVASKYIMGFKLAKKKDILVAFRDWVLDLRQDPIYKNYNWQMITVVKADNDGAWMRKHKKWMPMIEELGIRMFYVSHDRFEDSAEAESTVRINAIAGKRGMMARNADQADWDVFWDHGRFILNRTIALAASAERSPDGDQARPIEVFTHGWFSRARCNQELAYCEMPHTPLLVHDSGVTNSSGEPKAVWKVAKSMYMDQVICFDPWTGYERKTKSFDSFRLADGVGFRSFFNIKEPKRSKAERAIAEDFTETVTIFLPKPTANPPSMKNWKLPSNIEMVKHVLNGDRVPGMVVQHRADPADGEEPGSTIVNLWDNADTEELSKSSMFKGFNAPAGTSDNMEAQPDVKRMDKTVDPEIPGASTVDQQVPKPLDKRKQPDRASKEPVTNETGEQTEEPAAKPADKPVHKPTDMWQLDDEFAISFDDNCSVLPESIDPDLWNRAEMAKARSEAYIVPDDKTQMVKVLNKVDVKPIMYKIYMSWVINDTKMGYTVENWPIDNRKVVPKGSKFPKPQGVLWAKRVAEFWESKGLDAQNADVELPTQREFTSLRVMEEEATLAKLVQIGVERARVFTLSIRIAAENTKVTAEKAETYKTAVRSKDNVKIDPPPANLTKMWDNANAESWLQSLADEMTSLTDIGAVSHGHTLRELQEMGIVATPIATQVVFENKFKPADHAGKTSKEISDELSAKLHHEKADVIREKIDSALKLAQFMRDGRVTTDVEFDKNKARVVAVGNKQQMQKGVHYHETFAATPKTESSNLLSIIIVMLELYRRAFDIKNAFCWADQPIKLALDYPYGMPQYNSAGEKLYMALLKNTYGKPDGSKLFEDERNGVWLHELNKYGFTIVLPFKERSLFYIELHISKCTIPTLVESIQTESLRDARLVDKGIIQTWMLVHTDDANMGGQSNAVMDYIIKISDTAWKVKEVDPIYMLGVQHILTIEDGIWKMEHKMPLYIEGLVTTWAEWLDLAGWGKSSPKTPAPSKTVLTLSDPHGKVSDAESELVLKRGYMNLCGGLVWPIKSIYPEALYAVSNITTVMSRPSEAAWSYAMHVLAWLRENKNRGICFKSNSHYGKVPMASVDAALEIDEKDGRVRAGHEITMAGGPLLSKCWKLQRVAYSIPGAEYMELRNCAVDVMWIRILLSEIGLQLWVVDSTEIHCDSAGAIDWAIFGKLTVGNKHLKLAYHEVTDWVADNEIMPVKVLTLFNKSDMQTKSPTIDMTQKFVLWMTGYEDPPEGFIKYRLEQLEKSRGTFEPFKTSKFKDLAKKSKSMMDHKSS